MKSSYNREYSYMKKTTVKISALMLCRILFFSCFFVGIFIANTLWKNEAAWIGYLHENMLMQISELSNQSSNNFGYVVISRLPIWICLILFGKSMFGILLAEGFASWQGFSIGFSFAALMMRYGIPGSAWFLISIFPHGLVYVLTFCLLYHMICKLYRQKRISYLLGSGMEQYMVQSRSYVMVCIVLTALYLVGIFLESYVNVLLLTKMVAFFTNF